MRLVEFVLDGLLRFAPGEPGRAREERVERVVLVDSPLAARATGDGDLVVVAGGGAEVWRTASDRGAVGLVALRGAEDLPELTGAAQVLVPAGEARPDAVGLWSALEARMRRAREEELVAAAVRARRSRELSRLLVRLARERDGAAEVAAWGAGQLAARVWLVSPGDGPPFGAGWGGSGEVLDTLAAGAGEPMVERGTARGEYGVAVRVGSRVPHPVLLAVRAEAWTDEDLAVLSDVASGVEVAVWATDVAARAERLTSLSARMRVSALQYLMACDLAEAGRVLEHFVPGLVSAGSGVVAIVEGVDGEDRHRLARIVERALPMGSLTVECPVEDRHVIVVDRAPDGPQGLMDVLRPVVLAREGRAAGVSRTTPWLRTAGAYQGAMAALARVRGKSPAIGVDISGPGLEELLGLDARIWSALVMQPLEGLRRTEHTELAHLTAETLWWGPDAAARLVGRRRRVLAERLDRLSEWTGLDHRDPGQRAGLHLAVRLSALPAPPVLDQTVTMHQALDHPGARSWAEEILAPLEAPHRDALREWARTGGDPARAAEALGTGVPETDGLLREAAALTGKELLRYPGPAEEMLLALHVAGVTSLGSLPPLGERPLAVGRGEEPMDVSEINTDEPHVARVYDFLLGGRCNWPADRQVAERLLELNPLTRVAVHANRAFMQRSTRFLASEEGITQFLDLGSGIPTSPNLHEIAQSNNAGARVVYVDNDPIVLAHAEPLLRSTPQGATAYVEADVVRDTAALLEHPDVTALLDVDRPVAVSLNAIVHFMSDEVAHGMVDVLRAKLPRGSHLVITSMTHDYAPELIGTVRRYYSGQVVPLVTRTHAEMLEFFKGTELLEPGLVSGPRWRPESGAPAERDDHTNLYAGVARL
ncbi:SAM-dependent methyltransferase [Streptomyces sp. Z26]|uniref:SAM-dependent methyltransferase n=1 Tax=Streptomyces sp. Z26 TaxID=2500177 RepID=UPI0023E761B2|nr:SAM-dependent methyltransferase [Streptomyces sp. Z26]